MRYHRRIHILVAITLTLGAVSVVATQPETRPQPVQAAPVSSSGEMNYPRLGLYAGLSSDGTPLLLTPNGSVDGTTLDVLARYHHLILHASPATDTRQDIIAAIRARNSNIKLYGYVMGHMTWCTTSYGSTVYYRHYWELIEGYDNDGDTFDCQGTGDGFLWLNDGRKADAVLPSTNVNLAMKDNEGRYVIAEALADLWYRDLWQTGLWDGIFIDVYCPSLEYADPGTINYARAGYASKAAFWAGWREAHTALGVRLRQLVGSDAILIGNCGQGSSDLYAHFNGWMMENFPQQNGGTWAANMFNTSNGYFMNSRNYRTPVTSYIFTAADPSTAPYSTTNRQKARFGLGTASLDSGFGVFGDSSATLTAYRYDQWWYDEYAVNLTTGAASTSREHTGWLGQPTSERYQMILENSATDLVTNGEFETNTTGWNFIDFNNPSLGSMTRTTTDVASGSASVLLNVATVGPANYYTAIRSSGQVLVTSGQRYSLTFWAKASANRTIDIVLAPAGGSTFATQTIPITTGWKQYQVDLQPNQSGAANIAVNLGASTGQVLLDGIQFQAGVKNVFRRNFDHGIVLVNATSTAQTVPLETAYKKILGSVSSDVNDGSQVTSVTIPANDALFLLAIDLTPPAAITDLQANAGATTIGDTSIKPFGSDYTGKLWVKQIRFSDPAATVYLFVPLDRSPKGAIALYSEDGRELQRIRPFGRWETRGMYASIATQPGTSRIIFAVGSKRGGETAATYTVGRTRLTSRGKVAVGPNRSKRPVIVKMLKLRKNEYELVTMVGPRSRSSLRVWRYRPAASLFVRDTGISLKRIKVAGTTLTL